MSPELREQYFKATTPQLIGQCFRSYAAGLLGEVKGGTGLLSAAAVLELIARACGEWHQVGFRSGVAASRRQLEELADHLERFEGGGSSRG